jgi:hypothetical protein
VIIQKLIRLSGVETRIKSEWTREEKRCRKTRKKREVEKTNKIAKKLNSEITRELQEYNDKLRELQENNDKKWNKTKERAGEDHPS